MLTSTKLTILRKHIKNIYITIGVLNVLFSAITWFNHIMPGMYGYVDTAYISLRIIQGVILVASMILLIWDKRIFINNPYSFALQSSFGFACITAGIMTY